MKPKKRFLSLLLCAVLLASLLAGCISSNSSSSSASADSASSSAPDSTSADTSSEDENQPSSTTVADTSGLNPADFDENSIFSITGTSAAFDPCLGWGPGVSGCSLKSAKAAASLLQWAESANLSARTPDAIRDAFHRWYDDLTAAQQDNFAEAWTMIEPDAVTILSDRNSIASRLEDAGIDPDTLSGCTLKNWQALQTVLDEEIPVSQGEY